MEYLKKTGKSLVTAAAILFCGGLAQGADLFTGSGVDALRPVEAATDASFMVVEDAGGQRMQVYVGDRIGAEQGEVVQISSTLMKIRLGDTLRRITVFHDTDTSFGTGVLRKQSFQTHSSSP